MPSSPLNLSRVRRNILTYASLGVFCVAMITAAVLAYPFYLKQRDYSYASLEHVAQLEAVTLGEYIRRLEEISLQITSRTRARQILEGLNRGEIPAAASRDQLTPILADALNRGQEVVGIQRLDGNHNRLLSVGEAIDPLFWPPAPSLEEGLTLTGPVAIDGQWRLIVRALIRVPGQKKPVGTDIVSFSSEGLAGILASSFDGMGDGLAALAAKVNGEWRFLQGQQNGQLIDLTALQKPGIRPLFERQAAAADVPTVYFEGKDFGFAVSRIPGTDWRVLVQRNIKTLNAEVYSSIRLSFAVAVVLAAVGAIVTLVLIRPLSAMLARQASELEERVEEKTRRLMDITEELGTAREAAEEASRAKSRFLATTSHELRTPLNAIQGYAELIRNPSADDQSPERLSYYGEQIYEASEQLLSMINSLLDFSKVEAGKVQLSIEDVSLRDVLGMSMRSIEPMARSRDLTLDLTIAPGLSVVHADREALRRMVTNLLSNAVKFTDPPGQVTLSAWNEEDGNLVIEVADTGRGMTAGDLKKALLPFEQVDNNLNRQYPGTGLGLALVNGLVALHGGRLDLESEPGGGTKARLVFPLQQALAA